MATNPNPISHIPLDIKNTKPAQKQHRVSAQISQNGARFYGQHKKMCHQKNRYIHFARTYKPRESKLDAVLDIIHLLCVILQYEINTIDYPPIYTTAIEKYLQNPEPNRLK